MEQKCKLDIRIVYLPSIVSEEGEESLYQAKPCFHWNIWYTSFGLAFNILYLPYLLLPISQMKLPGEVSRVRNTKNMSGFSFNTPVEFLRTRIYFSESPPASKYLWSSKIFMEYLPPTTLFQTHQIFDKSIISFVRYETRNGICRSDCQVRVLFSSLLSILI